MVLVDPERKTELSWEDITKIHVDLEDDRLNKWIRVNSQRDPDLFYNKVYELIMRIKKKHDVNFKEVSEYFTNKLNVNIAPSVVYGWMGGEFSSKRKSVPLKVLDFLVKECYSENYKMSEEEKKRILELVDIVVVRSGKKLNLIRKINDNLCYIVGIIVGDGSCPNTFSDRDKTKKEYKVSISKKNKKFIDKIALRINRLFGTNIVSIKTEKDNTWNISLKSKYIQRLLTEVFEIPRGKKSSIVGMPFIIKNSTINNINSFVRGVIDSDGCIYVQKIRNYKQLKLTLRVRSKKLVDDISNYLKGQMYDVKKFSYTGCSFNRKNKVRFYGFYLNKNDTERYAGEIGFLNPHKVRTIARFFQGQSSSLKKGQFCLAHVSSRYQQ